MVKAKRQNNQQSDKKFSLAGIRTTQKKLFHRRARTTGLGLGIRETSLTSLREIVYL